MPSFAELLTPTGRERLAAVVRPEVPDHETLEAERLANLDRLAAPDYVTIVADLDAQDAEDEAMLPKSVREARETVGKIHKPRTKKRAPRLKCSPEELAAADEARLAEKRALYSVTRPQPEETAMPINLSALSDAELGRMVRSGVLGIRIDEIQANAEQVAAARADAQADDEALRVGEQAERKVDPAFLLPGFAVGDLTIATLDLRDKALGELVPAKVRSPYNKARYRLGIKEVLDPETTTWRELGAAHKQLAQHARSTPLPAVEPEAPTAPAVTLAVEIDPDLRAKKVSALAKTLGISKREAKAHLTALSL